MPDNSWRYRPVAIEKYWPHIIGETEQFKEIAAAQNPPLNLAWENVFDGGDESFVATASVYGIERFEAMLDIITDVGDSLDVRRARILTTLNTKAPFTKITVRKMLLAIIGDSTNLLLFDYNNDTYSLLVELDEKVHYLESSIIDFFRRVLPMSVVLYLKFS